MANDKGRGLRVRDVERELAAAGFTLDHIRGSHRTYTNKRGDRITFAPFDKARNPEVDRHIVARVRRELAACGSPV